MRPDKIHEGAFAIRAVPATEVVASSRGQVLLLPRLLDRGRGFFEGLCLTPQADEEELFGHRGVRAVTPRCASGQRADEV